MTDIVTDALKIEGIKNWQRIQNESRLRYMKKRAKYKRTMTTKARSPKKQPKIPKEKSRGQLIKQLDTLFSHYLRNKAKGRCSRCNQVKKNAGVSHYWSRKHIGTRWEVKNCDWACWLPCHSIWEHEKQGEYMDFMIKKLGEKGYEELRIKALSVTKFSTQDIKFMISQFDSIWI